LMSQACFSKSGYLISRARLSTAHQIGTVLESASGIRFPERVESTSIKLQTQLRCNKKKERETPHMKFGNEIEEMDIWSTKVEIPVVKMAISRFEVCGYISGLQRVFFLFLILHEKPPVTLTMSGLVYQAPQRKFAVSNCQ